MTAPKNITRRRTKMTKPFHWFQGDSVRELVRQLAEAGANPRLEVHTDGKSMTFAVIPTDIILQSHNPTHINDSHVCPPDCPPR